ncbi:SLC13 family permease [Desulforhabdus amnigena]|jgi:di/tricarboxylate transporter|uniref:SLC13 family permease n=1 Tax=Desulforhabdus amnigena TaxID=40218 RepID=A0A9W6CWU9_9BACT|nr:SLC13 family permease [Desulforhabdus amnigena]NLJ27197.1 SLC13 family permease [Deltaproteobacteria bacterium]GLI34049.1 SLC13 family permease [Desulforhabdus amnigena]
MNTEQLLVFGILAATLVLFVWNRWRYDLVALGALLAVAGLTPTDQVFAGFGHPAVVTVAAVLVLSRGLLNAGVVDTIAQSLGRVGNQPMIQVATLTGVVALCSGFMNNVGALALLMPVAIWMSRQSSRPPSLLLMPLAFGSLLGGTITLIGTPPNIIIAAYRAQTGAPPFGMFEFFPVGIGITLVGVLFISLVGWRLTPKREKQGTPEELFQIGDYISEVRVTEHSKVLGQTLHDLLSLMESESDVTIVGLFRGKQRHMAPSMYAVLQAGDILMVETDPESLKGMIDAAGLELAESGDIGKGDLGADDVSIIEAIVAPESLLLGRTAANLDMRARYGVNVLAVARQGQRVRERLSKIRFNIADILLLQGRTDSLQAALSAWGCLPLAERGLRIGKPRKVFLAAAIFVAALALVAFNLLPAQVALVGAAVVMVLSGLLTLKEAYKSIDWPIIVLLAAMIPVGQALESTGGAQLIADQLLRVARSSSPAETLAILMVGTMLLSNVVNNAAAAILMAPIAIGVAHGMGSSPDPLLMAVAIGSSCAFLTPIGHQSNALVMAPGGYRFGDYWRLGLPLSVLVVGVAVPLIMWFWPL